MRKEQVTASFLTRLFIAEEKTGLGLMDLTENTTGVYRQARCVFTGNYGEACRYIFRAAGMTVTEVPQKRLIYVSERNGGKI